MFYFFAHSPDSDAVNVQSNKKLLFNRKFNYFFTMQVPQKTTGHTLNYTLNPDIQSSSIAKITVPTSNDLENRNKIEHILSASISFLRQFKALLYIIHEYFISSYNNRHYHKYKDAVLKNIYTILDI